MRLDKDSPKALILRDRDHGHHKLSKDRPDRGSNGMVVHVPQMKTCLVLRLTQNLASLMKPRLSLAAENTNHSLCDLHNCVHNCVPLTKLVVYYVHS